jgi:hypothetical protein
MAHHDKGGSAVDSGSMESLAVPALPLHRRRSELEGGRPDFYPQERAASLDITITTGLPSIHSLPAYHVGGDASLEPAFVASSASIAGASAGVVNATASGTSSHAIQPLEVEDREELSTAQRMAFRRKDTVQYAAACFALFMSGWNDGSTGPLMPTVQSFYHVCFRVV